MAIKPKVMLGMIRSTWLRLALTLTQISLDVRLVDDVLLLISEKSTALESEIIVLILNNI